MPRGRKPKKQARVQDEELEPVGEDESEEETASEDDIVMAEDDDDDADGDTLELPSLSEIAGAAASASARRRVEEYLEMRRAARELHDLEDFDFD
jgi:hypothetical protein